MKENLINWNKHEIESWLCTQAMIEDGVKDKVYQEQIDRATAHLAALEVLEEITAICFNGFEYLQDQREINLLQNILKTITSKFGYHEEGQGWSPEGEYCGECSDYNCIGCTATKEEPCQKPQKKSLEF